MYGCENWTIKKAKHQGIDAFERVVLEKRLESPLDCKAIKPVNPKGNLLWKFFGNTNSEAEVPILWPPDVKSWLTGDLDTGKIESKRRRGHQRMRWFDGITDSVNMKLSKLLEIAKDTEAWHAAVHGLQIVRHELGTEQQQWCTLG